MENHTEQMYLCVEPVTYVGEIWDLDDTFEELHFSGSVEELCEAAEQNTAVTDRTHKRYESVFLPDNTDSIYTL